MGCSSTPADDTSTGGTGGSQTPAAGNGGSGGTAGTNTGTGGSGTGGTAPGGSPGTGGLPAGGTPGTGGTVAGAPSGGAGGSAGAAPVAGQGGTGGDGAGGAPMGGSGTMAGAGGSAGGGATKWVGTWATGPQLTETENNPPSPGLANNTLRQIFRVSIGGSSLRLRLSNEYGDGPVTMSAVHLAKSTSAGAIDTASDKALTFGGMASVTIQDGETADSDAFDFDLAPLSKVAVTIQFGTTPSGITGHPGSRTTSYLVSGDMVSAASITGSTAEHWYYISALDVIAPENAYSVAILGDSITDGRGSTTDGNDRWPDKLAERLQANAATKNIGVLNLGIGGNAILTGGKGPTAKARFDVQILGQSGVRWFIVLEGVNDIGNAGSAQGSQLDSAFQEFITKAKAKGVLAYGSPILPFGGSSYSSPEHEADRQTVNDWVRAAGHFDAVIDLDAAVRDSSNAANLDSAYDSGDQLHLNPAGYAKMADAVDLALLTP